MKIKLYRSATVGIDIDGFKILTDPWLTDGEYYGSWSHYPPFEINKNIQEINSYDAIFVSHIHPDHCSDNTMKIINKDIPVYIHKFHSPFLKNKLNRFGFKVIELENNKKFEIAKNIKLNIIAADNCNPELCYKLTGCADLNATGGSQQIDSLSIIESKKNVLVNVNDCPSRLAQPAMEEINKQYNKVDVLLCGYQNASPYPQCFESLDTLNKEKLGKKVSKECMDKALHFIKSLKPEYYLPFAGTYALTGRLSVLNDFRYVPTIDEAYEYISSKQSFSKPIKINPGTSFDLNNNQNSDPYKKFDVKKYNKYVKDILSKKEFDYEKEEKPTFEEIYELAQGAYKKYIDKKLIYNINLNTDIYISVEQKFFKISKEGSKLEVIKKDEINKSSQFVIYETDIRLLKLLLNGPRFAHWNNAEIGSHIKFTRNPDVWTPAVYQSICYFHN
jgi:UDP-MurNAc hydroxylase